MTYNGAKGKTQAAMAKTLNVRALIGGYQLLFLPKYSPDLNDIEHDFSALKRARMYSPINTSRFGNYS